MKRACCEIRPFLIHLPRIAKFINDYVCFTGRLRNPPVFHIFADAIKK